MTWTKIPDAHFDQLDVLELSRSARLLDIEATVFSNKVLSDGFIPATALRRITDSSDVDADTTELVAAGRWEAVDGGWQIANWTKSQEPAERVRKRQDKWAERAIRARLHRGGDHSTCDARWCQYVSPDQSHEESHAVTPGETHDESHPTPSRPDPSRPEGPGDGEGAIGAATAPPPAPRPKDEPAHLRPVCPHGQAGGRDATKAGTFQCPICRREAEAAS